MTTAIAQVPISAEAMEQVLGHGNLESLTPTQMADYLVALCRSVGVNPLTRPFQIIKLNGRLVVYATKSCTEQLAGLHNISTRLDEGREVEGIWIVRCTASMPDGRSADAIGAVEIKGKTGMNRANAMMAAETKASRRAVLRLIGLGILDEVELTGLDTEPVAQAAPRRKEQPAIESNSSTGMTAEMAFKARVARFTDVSEFNEAIAEFTDDTDRGIKQILWQGAKALGFVYDQEFRIFADPSTDAYYAPIAENSDLAKEFEYPDE